MAKLKFILFALVLWCQVIDIFSMSGSDDYCFSKDPLKPQFKHFTSHGAYQVVKGSKLEELVPTPYCKPIKLYLLTRHGTRMPKKDQIKALPDLEDLRDNIISNYKKTVANGLCDEDYKLIHNWVLDKNITTAYTQYLTTQGWQDLKISAQDFKRAFPELLNNYDKDKFLFRHVNTQVSEASLKAFLEGLFGENAIEWVDYVRPPKPDSLLRAAKECDEWLEREDDMIADGTQGGFFKESYVMKATLTRVSDRLGFEKTLKYKLVKQMFDMCRFESAWHIDQPSAWCTPFQMEDVLVFEYLDDLGKEYSSGYGSQLNANVPCEAVQDMLNRLNSDEDPRVVVYVSNSALIQMFAVALGIQNDNSLLTSSMFSTAGNRKWRTSELDPFASNYAVVKYDCSADQVDPSTKVKFIVNESPIDFEGCPKGFCKLSDLMNYYKKYVNANCEEVFCTERELE